MTKDDLTRLDNYSHKPLEDLSELQLNEYATLLHMRRGEVLKRVLELKKLTISEGLDRLAKMVEEAKAK